MAPRTTIDPPPCVIPRPNNAIADELLRDIDKDTVDFIPNYDNQTTEPTVMPARLPNLLLNGSTGIAVGMATNIPPHNLVEVCNGIMHLIDNPDATTEDLSRIVRGPDFLLAASSGREGIRNTYANGRGASSCVPARISKRPNAAA